MDDHSNPHNCLSNEHLEKERHFAGWDKACGERRTSCGKQDVFVPVAKTSTFAFKKRWHSCLWRELYCLWREKCILACGERCTLLPVEIKMYSFPLKEGTLVCGERSI